MYTRETQTSHERTRQSPISRAIARPEPLRCRKIVACPHPYLRKNATIRRPLPLSLRKPLDFAPFSGGAAEKRHSTDRTGHEGSVPTFVTVRAALFRVPTETPVKPLKTVLSQFCSCPFLTGFTGFSGLQFSSLLPDREILTILSILSEKRRFRKPPHPSRLRQGHGG